MQTIHDLDTISYGSNETNPISTFFNSLLLTIPYNITTLWPRKFAPFLTALPLLEVIFCSNSDYRLVEKGTKEFNLLRWL